MTHILSQAVSSQRAVRVPHAFVFEITTHMGASIAPTEKKSVLISAAFLLAAILRMTMFGGVRREPELIDPFPFVPAIPIDGSGQHTLGS